MATYMVKSNFVQYNNIKNNRHKLSEKQLNWLEKINRRIVLRIVVQRPNTDQKLNAAKFEETAPSKNPMQLQLKNPIIQYFIWKFVLSLVALPKM